MALTVVKSALLCLGTVFGAGFVFGVIRTLGRLVLRARCGRRWLRDLVHDRRRRALLGGNLFCPFGESTDDISANEVMLDLFETVQLPQKARPTRQTSCIEGEPTA
jgi:hypothetical protein